MRTLAWSCCAVAALAQSPETTVEGAVSDSSSGLPIAGARVRVSGCGRYLSAVTNDRGEFRLENVPPCRYQASANKQGYLGSDYGTRPVPVTQAKKVSIRLLPTATIDGRVLDEDHRPLGGVNVYAKKTPGQPHHTVTDEQGRYEFNDLAPGEYGVEARLPFGIRSKSFKDAYGLPAIVRSPDVVRVSAGLRTAGIDFALRRVRLVEVRGQIVDLVSKQPLSGASVVLGSTVGATDDDMGGPQNVDGDGRFRLKQVEPGDYRLKVFRAGEALPYVLALAVTRDGIDGKTIEVPPPGDIAGVVVWPKGAEKPANLSVRLSVEGSAVRESPVDAEGRFVFQRVPAGHYGLQTSLPPASLAVMRRFGMPSLYEAEWRCSGEPCAQYRMVVQPQSTLQVEVILGSDTGTVTGKVKADPQDAAASARIVFVPAAGGLDFQSSADTAGAFEPVVLPPGIYRAFAVAGAADLRALYRKCMAEAGSIEVRKNETTAVELKLCRP